MTAPPRETPKATPKPAESKTERNERAARALTMRNAGATYTRIAEQLGISEQQVKNDITRAIKEWVRVPAEQMVDRQRAILLDIMRVEYPAAMDVNSPRHYQAQEKVLEVLAHEAKLHGLYAPTKVNFGISEAEFARQAAELLQVTGVRPLLELARIDEPVDAEVVADVDESWSNL